MEICRIRFSLAQLSSIAFRTHLKLATVIHENLWTIIDASAALKAGKEGHMAQIRHNMKLQNLEERCSKECILDSVESAVRQHTRGIIKRVDGVSEKYARRNGSVLCSPIAEN